MQDEKWQQLVEAAKQNFKNVEYRTEDLIAETADGPQKQGTRDILEFDHPSGGRYRLIRENKPVVLEKKEHFSHRQGDTARTEYKFSETEFSHKLKVYREIDFDEWEEITLDKLGL
ncbi:MAG: hypothetical protein M1383_06055 [Patescibacteria group bacterium]|nr:hypothetical protein [Patescibacteria group bacterium]